MRIRNQFIISMAVFSVVLTIIAGSVVITEQQLAEVTSQELAVGNIERGANDLNYISNSYFLYQENLQISQWQSEFSVLSDNLSSLSLNTPQQQTFVSNIEGDLQRLNSVFGDVVIFLQNVPRNVSVRIDPLFQSQWNRMAVQNQALAYDASQLSQALNNQATQIKQENLVLIFSLLVIFSAFFVTIYLIAFRRTLKSISNLQAGINIIGSGNLDYSIKPNKQDEIGELSDAFNQMTANLKIVTASKTDLEQEINRRKQAETSLRESEQRLRFHAENIPLAVVEWNSNFVVTRWAGDAEKIFGWTASETIGKPIMDLGMIYGPDIPIVEKTMLQLTSGDDKVVSSNRNITKEGKVIYCRWINSVLLDERGKMVSVFSFVEDNTAKMKAEKALEDTNRNLEKLIEERTKQLKDSERLAAIGATAGMVGHDIRNPLQTVTGELYLAKSELDNMPDGIAKTNIKESLDVIGEQTVYVNKIVSDLQDYAKPLTPKLEETDLKKIVQTVLTTVEIPENVKVKQAIEKDFPKLKIDQSYMQRILQNLTNNAVQAMPSGGKLTINVARKGEKAVITVEDTGEGIPMDVRGKLFTPLVTTKSRGQGFGLAVVKRLTESLNGTVTFESEVGKGTKFIIELPF